jgi:hypothetical protein
MPSNVAFLSNRLRAAAGVSPVLGETVMPGPALWGFTQASRDDSREGWCWSAVGDPGQPAPVAFVLPGAVLDALREHLAGGPQRGLLVHVHGAGNDTAYSLWRAPRLAERFGAPDFELMPLAISWACGGFSPGDYKLAASWQGTPQKRPGIADIAEAFATLLDGLRVLGGSSRPFFLTVHSMGHRLLAGMLAHLDHRGLLPSAPPDAFRAIALCAADIERNALGDGGALSALGRLAGRIGVVFNRNDPLMQLSFWGNGFQLPLGLLGPQGELEQTPDGTPVHALDCVQPEQALANPDELTPGHHYWHLEDAAAARIAGLFRLPLP